jgi:hypothetical protein
MHVGMERVYGYGYGYELRETYRKGGFWAWLSQAFS